MIKTKEDLHKTFFCASETELKRKVLELLGKEFNPLRLDAHYLNVDPYGNLGWMPLHANDEITSEEWYIGQGYRKITLADFEPEVVIPEKKDSITKGDLLGIKVRISSREQWDRLKELCEGVGWEHATWSNCYFDESTEFFMCGWLGRFLATHDIKDEDCSKEFYNLREVEYEDLFAVEEKELPEPEVKPTPKYKYTLVDKSPEEIYRAMLDGETFYEDNGEVELSFDGFQFLSKDTNNGARITLKCITNDNQICTREEIKWQNEVANYLNKCKSGVGFLDVAVHCGNEFSLSNEDFLEAARIALKATGELK